MHNYRGYKYRFSTDSVSFYSVRIAISYLICNRKIAEKEVIFNHSDCI